MAAVRLERWRRRGHTSPVELGAAYKSAALRWIRRQPRMKSCRVEDITRLAKHMPECGRMFYEITAKGKTFILYA